MKTSTEDKAISTNTDDKPDQTSKINTENKARSENALGQHSSNMPEKDDNAAGDKIQTGSGQNQILISVRQRICLRVKMLKTRIFI